MALALDGQNSASVTSTTPGITLTTTGTSNIIVFISRANVICGAITSVTDTAGLTWNRRLTFNFPNGTPQTIEVWYAVTTSAYAGGTITANYTSAVADAKRLIVYSVSGVLTTAPFDASPIFPSYKTALTSTAMTATAPPLDTLNPNTIIFDIVGMAGAAGTITAPSGYTALTVGLGTAHAGSYKVYATAQTGLSPQYTWVTANDAFGIWDAFTSDAAVLSAGTAVLTATGNGTATVADTATGGTSPYTYQWHRDTVSGFTPGAGNLVSGATSATLADTGLTNGTVYFYKCVVTDDVSDTATSNQVAVVPNGVKYVGLIGDSWNNTTCASSSGTAVTGAAGAGSLLQQKLEGLYSDGTSVVVSNQGIGGTNGNDWATGSNLSTALANMLAVHSPASDWTVMVHLGVNDSSINFSNPSGGESLAQFQAYMQTIANYVLNTWGAARIIFHAPPYIKAQGSNHTTAGVTLLKDYKTAILNVVAATPKAFLGADEYAHFANNLSDVGGDFVHPTPVDTYGNGGAINLATMWAKAAYGIISPNALWSHY